MKRICTVLLVVCACASTPALADIQAGNWEFTVDVAIQDSGSPTGPVTNTRCITEEEARDPAKVLSETGSSKCEFSNRRDTGSEYTFDVDCKDGPVPVHGAGNVRYTPQSMQGQVELTGETHNLKFKTRSTISARRLGPCEK